MNGLLSQQEIKNKINNIQRNKEQNNEQDNFRLKEKEKYYHLDKIKYQNYKYSKPSRKYYDVFYPQQRETNIKHFEINSQKLKECQISQNRIMKHNQYVYVNNPQLQSQTTDKMIKSSLLKQVKQNISYDFNKSNKFIIKNKPQYEKYVQQKRNVVNIDKLQFLDFNKQLVYKINDQTVLLKTQFSNLENKKSESVQERNEVYQIINEYNQLHRQYNQYLKQNDNENDYPINPYSIQDIQQKMSSKYDNEPQEIYDEKSNNYSELKSFRSYDHSVSYFSGFQTSRINGKTQFCSLQQTGFVKNKGIEVFVVKQKFQKYFDKMDFTILSRMLMIFGIDLNNLHQQIDFSQFQLMFQFLINQKPYENDLRIFIQRFFYVETSKVEFIQLIKYLCQNYKGNHNLKNQSRLNNIVKDNMFDYFINIFESHKILKDSEEIDSQEFKKLDIHTYYQLYQLILGSG